MPTATAQQQATGTGTGSERDPVGSGGASKGSGGASSGSGGASNGSGGVAQSGDADGHPRVDYAATANTGAGAVPYADMGAFEFQP